MRRPSSARTFCLMLGTLLTLGLAGCDMLGVESGAVVAARREADGKAVGAGCRHAARSVEQCYELNKRAEKAAVFAGWKEMNDYMRENKIDAVPAPSDAATEVASATTDEPEHKAAPSEKPGKPGKPGRSDKPEKPATTKH
jgi:hypothetical protein